MAADPSFWNNLAEKYAKQPVELPQAFERKIGITSNLMKPTDTLLEVGCGTGSLALRLAPFAAHIHALDLSNEMVRIARGKVSSQGFGNIAFHVGAFDESFSTFADGSFDGVCAYSILHLVDDRDEALARMFRLLKPGGFFVSSTACRGESWIPYGPVITVMRWLGKAPMVKIFSKADCAESVRAARFVDVESPDVGAQPECAFLVARRPN